MTKQKLIDIFTAAKNNKTDVAVEVTIPGQDDTEYIINKYKSIDNKLQYYLDTYNDNLIHCRNEDIRIINAFLLDFYMGGEH